MKKPAALPESKWSGEAVTTTVDGAARSNQQNPAGRRLTQALALSLLTLAFLPRYAEAGIMSTSFEASDGVPGMLYGSAIVDTGGGMNNSGVLKLTSGNGQAGFLLLDDLDSGQTIGSFTAAFDLRTGSDTSSVLHGDGFSLSFGADIPDDTFGFPEEGTGTGLRISFDTFNNAGPANEAPAIKVSFANRLIASKTVDFLSTGKGYVPVKIAIQAAGTLDLSYGTNSVFTNLLVYTTVAGRFALAANAASERFVGDPIDLYWVDNLSITTKVSQAAHLISASPRGDSAAPDAVVQVQLHDSGTHILTNSIQLKFDNSTVTASITKSGEDTLISYDPAGFLLPASTHSVSLVYADDSSPPTTNSVSYSFTVYPYATLPGSYAISASRVNTSAPGFKVRAHQISLDVGTSTQRAELQFANKLLNPLDGTLLPNIADLTSANPDGTFDISSSINFSTSPTPAGFFSDDVYPPGIVGTDQYALEIMAYINLAPGAYTFGINAVRNYNTTAPGSFRESGFRLTAGNNPRDLFAPEIASFDKNRPEGEKLFSFVVQQAGIYPFRLLWFSGVGESNLEWYQVVPSGNRILLGNTAAGGLTVYSEASSTPPFVQYTTVPSPGETGVAPNTGISFAIADGGATVQTNTIQLSLNGAAVAAAISNDSSSPGLTQVSYHPPAVLPAGSSNTVRLIFTDNAGAAYNQSWSFTVAGTATIPGLLTMEAEHFATNTPISINGTSWQLTSSIPGFSGTGAMEATPNVNLNVNVDTTISPRLDYNLNFGLAGKYYVWVRASGDSAPGISQNDSVNVGIDGLLPDTSAKITGFPPGGYVWSRTTVASTPATLIVLTPGPHVVSVWMREDGFVFDKLLFTTNNAYTPTAFGPAENTVGQPLLSHSLAGNTLKLSWTGEGALQTATEVTGPYTPFVGGGASPITVNLDEARRFFRVAN
ncbi:MAG: nanM 1 [Verrucomicrobiales bacterium]|nr:nanM 1 [Verrucomicrobiales bacterium]